MAKGKTRPWIRILKKQCSWQQITLTTIQLMFIGATVCGALYILLIFFGPDIDTGLYGFLNGGLLGIMFGMLIMGIFITDKNFRKVTEWKQSKLGKNKK